MQALYQFEIRPDELDHILTFEWTDDKVRKHINDFALTLFNGTIEHRKEIDKKISKFTKNWDMDRIGQVELSILRLSVYSFLYQKDMPVNVIIDEAVYLAKRFGNEDSYKFINGVLDGIAGFFDKAENKSSHKNSEV